MTEAAAEGVLPWLKLHGRGTLSYLLRYEAAWNYFEDPKGVVPWLVGPGTAIAWTDPLCAEDNIPEVLSAYTQAMRDERRAVCLFVVGDASARAALGLGYSVLGIGQEPWFDLTTWELPRGNRGRGMRWSLNHARRAGTEINEYRPGEGRDAAIDAQIWDVLEQWRRGFSRKVADSLLRPSPLDVAEDKRIFIASVDGRAQAFVSCCPVYGVGGYYMEDLVRAPSCVNGTSELLVVEGLHRLQASGVKRAALGIAPFRSTGEQMDPRARFLWPVLMFGVRSVKTRYNLPALMKYPERFHPTHWVNRHLAFFPAFPRPRLIAAIAKSV